ncbi:WhiB family transcriptional regulator [Planobispora longispora]|uniref:Transcriptional regulator WhiB n=1 Tax=Planobispora longispora TaxID=28887 RepID=A0A8J3RK71_9ACTN|nr:WhiB family transcriptional regulator [Planobispora longispora]BFE85801.1 transcriptional regulator WhiB2 [Planobispora longispora]GIH76165.1 transcriptional regulator WhiB [Planobispora longispora]
MSHSSVPEYVRDWRDGAACDGLPTDLFFPSKAAGSFDKRWCRICEVRKQCLNYAMRIEGAGPRHGLWGGLSPAERDALYRHRNGTA